MVLRAVRFCLCHYSYTNSTVLYELHTIHGSSLRFHVMLRGIVRTAGILRYGVWTLHQRNLEKREHSIFQFSEVEILTLLICEFTFFIEFISN